VVFCSGGMGGEATGEFTRRITEERLRSQKEEGAKKKSLHGSKGGGNPPSQTLSKGVGFHEKKAAMVNRLQESIPPGQHGGNRGGRELKP